MSRVLDKFRHVSTYKKDYCGRALPLWEVGNVAKTPAEYNCKAKFVPGIALELPNDMKPPKRCCCGPGGYMPPRGAIASGLPNNLDCECICFNKKRGQRNFKVGRVNNKRQKETKPDETCYHIYYVVKSDNFDRSSKGQKKKLPTINDPYFVGIRPIPRGKFGGQFEGPRPNEPCRPQPQTSGGIPWLQPRADERRDPDVINLRRHRVVDEIEDIVHGEERRRLNPTPWAPRRASVTGGTQTRIPGPFWMRQRRDERRDVDIARKRKFERTPSEVKEIIHGGGVGRERLVPRGRGRRSFTPYSEIKYVIHGGVGRPSNVRHPLDIPRLYRRKSSSSRIPGPFWLHNRPDARREPDVLRKRKFTVSNEVRDVIHGEEERARNRLAGRPGVPSTSQGITRRSSLPVLQPFWLLERKDERREPDFDAKRLSGRPRHEAAEIVHGVDFRQQWYPSTSNAIDEESILEDDSDDDDDEEPFKYKRACRCAPRPRGATSGWDSWTPSLDDMMSREEEAYYPEARLSCPPTADTSRFDQPNTFMRKILKETPPEELISKVFKDRFLSTYQVDYLHMGVGRRTHLGGGREAEEMLYDVDEEPEVVPGCSYRRNTKGDYGRKKTEYKRERETKEDDSMPEKMEKEEPRVSEYMATISRLGGEIVTDQLYKVAEITKKLKSQYNVM